MAAPNNCIPHPPSGGCSSSAASSTSQPPCQLRNHLNLPTNNNNSTTANNNNHNHNAKKEKWNSEAGASSALGNYQCSTTPVSCSPGGPRFKLLVEGDVQVCRLNHTRTVVSKILSSKFLRRWETHRLQLAHAYIHSKTPFGFLEEPISYSSIEDIYVVTRWECHQKYCIRIVVPDGSLLLQLSNGYYRDQWFHSILWKKKLFRHERLLLATQRLEVLIKEIKNLVELSVTTPIQDECIYQDPLKLISRVLPQISQDIQRPLLEELLTILIPIVEKNQPTPEICEFFRKHCQENPRSNFVTDTFTPVVQRILKHNVDFGKYPRTRLFLQDFITALGAKNNGTEVVLEFVKSMHGRGSTCPHPRVLPNLVSVCLAAIYSLFESKQSDELNDAKVILTNEIEEKLDCFIVCFRTMATFEDWRPALALLLQPIPFPNKALMYEKFSFGLQRAIEPIATDPRCEVHLTILGIRDGKEGWFHYFCPGSTTCHDDGKLWAQMLQTLFKCCCRRKYFLTMLVKMAGPCMLLALRDSSICQEVLCAMLELEVVENRDQRLQIFTTLQSTTSGMNHYASLCERQMHLRELQQKGGPRKLTLPSRSTDADLAKLLSCGSFGNLECLSLAFTQVTSACAEQLIKLPSLKYLNLWSTQFGDYGLQVISEHLHKLQVLNLCETPVTDKGLISLAAMKNLRKLNLNSTSLSAYTFEGLKQKLPALQECDVRYTDAW